MFHTIIGFKIGAVTRFLGGNFVFIYSFFVWQSVKYVIHVYAVIRTRPNFPYASMVAKRGLTNPTNVHTPFVNKAFKAQCGRIIINPAVLAAIGHRIIAPTKFKN